MNQIIIHIDNKTICDLECILDGYFEPLKTFMNKKDWQSVLLSMHLSTGEFFPLPINLAVNKDIHIYQDSIVRLVDETNYPLAEMKINDIYEPDIDFECLHAYGTLDDNHPYVKYKQLHKGKYYISGELKKLNRFRHYDHIQERLTSAETRNYFKAIGWTENIIGFQTRNPMHKAHYELTKYALNEVPNSKLFLNPVVGETQSHDIDYLTRIKCYKAILPKYDQVLLGLLPLAMRMAGPKEACLHALIRRNYGCTHFIVGRDHAGPSYKTKDGNHFYEPCEAQNLFVKYADEIGIKPVISKNIVYNQTKNMYQPICDIESGDAILELSGTDMREHLKNNMEIPDWFSYPEVISILKNSIKKRGICYSFIGLSCSGKTTAANILRTMILEEYPNKEITMLDGDVVRKHLSSFGFTKEDREVNIRRIGYVASEIVKHGGIVICANISPYDYLRLENRKLVEDNGGKYFEIFIDVDIKICEMRDTKGLYKLAREGHIKNFTGISDPFEIPTKTNLVLNEVESEKCLELLKNLVTKIAK